MFDIIGDIHGYAKALVLLLKKLGYDNKKGYWSHPKRKIIFTGDFIDRGPDIVETLRIVKAMIDAGAAISVSGNHEYNAISYHTKDENGNFLREHSPKNVRVHSATVAQFADKQEEWEMYLEWFKTLPLFIEFDNFRIIHATWDFEYIEFIKEQLPNIKSTSEFREKSMREGTKEHTAIEILLKGKEVYLPENEIFIDKDGNPRQMIRFKWWIETNNVTYKQVSVIQYDNIPKIEVPQKFFENHKPYLPDQKIIFIGHYWLSGIPKIQTPNVCCVDYSIAKRHKLVAYRYNGEKVLSNDNFVFVKHEQAY